MSNYKYIAIAGNMGSGKSSLTEFLCKYFKNLVPIFEPNDENPYLADFYKDMKKWAFRSQIFFLTRKFALHQSFANLTSTMIQDRTIYEDAEIFARNLYLQGFIDKRDYNVYHSLYKNMMNSLRPPDLLIYLECSLRTVRKRIAKRGRTIELKVDPKYIKRLNNLYKKWVENYKLSPVLKLSTEKLEYISDFVHRNDLLEKIGKYI